MQPMELHLDDRFRTEVTADKNMENSRRQVLDACFSYVSPKKTSKPKLLHAAPEMLAAIGLTEEMGRTTEFRDIVTGNALIPNSHPYAMCYGGHQFGNWAGQLGDGRAINLGEVVHEQQRWALQLKGAGETPYSRTADGLAVLRSSIREYLCSEAMHHLGIPTTRALSLSLTGDKVLRDVLYNGNPAYEPGAIVCRAAASFIRFGNFEIQTARENKALLQQLADHSIRHFYPEIKSSGKEKYLEFFQAVRDKTIDMIVHWQRVGFVHGVMNTDNMSILGLTIDYGPYGWLENYDPSWTPNTTDAQHRRYRFGNQPYIGLWNLFKLANALFPLVEEVAPLQSILEAYNPLFDEAYLAMMKNKLGITQVAHEDAELIQRLEETLTLVEVDMTLFFRLLARVEKKDTPTRALNKLQTAFYQWNDLNEEAAKHWNNWLTRYLKRLQTETQNDAERSAAMDRVNPKYVLRNYMAQMAIEQASSGSYELIDELFRLLKKPYDEQPSQEKWFAKRPEWARHKVGCSMLSCSS